MAIDVHQLLSLQKLVIEFREERNWAQFHWDSATFLAMNAEVGELGGAVAYIRTDDEIDEADKANIREEIADVLYWILLICYQAEIDLKGLVREPVSGISTRHAIRKVVCRFARLLSHSCSDVHALRYDTPAIERAFQDMFPYLNTVAANLNFDLYQALVDKLGHNALKYPVEESNGSRKKMEMPT